MRMQLHVWAAAILVTSSEFCVAESAPSTDEFMNILAVCGAGSGITLDSDLHGSISSLYERERTQGRATQHIVAKIIELLPEPQRLAAYTAYLGCVEKQKNGRSVRIDKLTEPFNTTYPENTHVIEFLDTHAGKIIFVDSYIDTSVIMSSPFLSADEACSGTTDRQGSGVTYNDLTLPNVVDKSLLQNDDVKPDDVDCRTAVVFRTINKELDWTSGGTGIMMYPLQGFFKVKWVYSGSVKTYILEEQPASVELQSQMAN